MAAGARKKRGKSGSGWSWRLAGIALCAFFVLGVITGLSQSGHLLARRIEALLQRLPHSNHSELIPAAYRRFFKERPEDRRPSSASPTQTIALAEHQDGFYQVDSEGGLFGPISPTDASDLPILSGTAIEHASPAELLEYSAEVIRAEAALGVIISEMRVTSSDEVRLYLDHPHLVIVLTRAALPLQLARAGKVLSVRREHPSPVMIDMTVPDEAIVRPQAEVLERSAPVNNRRAARSRKFVDAFRERTMFSEAAITH